MSSSSWVVVPTGESPTLKEIIIEESLNGTKRKQCANSNVESKKYNRKEIVEENDATSDALTNKQFRQRPLEENATKKRKKKFNKTVNVPVLFSDYDNQLQNIGPERKSHEEEIEDLYDDSDCDQSDAIKKEITKYDIVFSRSENKVAEHSYRWLPKVQNVSDLDIDHFSKLALCNMVKSRILKNINHVISSKTSYIVIAGEYHPTCSDSAQSQKCTIKVFRLSQEAYTSLTNATNICLNRDANNAWPGKVYRRYLNTLAKEEIEQLAHSNRIGVLRPKIIYAKDNILIQESAYH